LITNGNKNQLSLCYIVSKDFDKQCDSLKSQFKPGFCGFCMKYLYLTGYPNDQAVSIIKHFPVNKMRLTSTAETILGPKGPHVIL